MIKVFFISLEGYQKGTQSSRQKLGIKSLEKIFRSGTVCKSSTLKVHLQDNI